jgi:anti-anti-sigma factor
MQPGGALEIRTVSIGGVPAVSVVGEVDRLAGKALKRAIAEVLQGPDGPSCILVDLSECTYVDAVALSVLMSARDRLTPGRCLGLVGASDSIRNLFRVIGFEESDSLCFLSSRAQVQALRMKCDTHEGEGPVFGTHTQKEARQ